MKKLIFRAPVQTASGYGVHSRMLLRALDKSDLFDITVMSVPWGATPLIYDRSPEMDRITELANRFDPSKGPDDYDASVQVTIPNEFVRLARMNIGVTAGIETDRVSAMWLARVNSQVDLLVVPSKHSYDAFLHTVQRVTDPEQAKRLGVAPGTELRLERPMHLLPEWADPTVFNTAVLDGPTLPVVDEALAGMPDFNYLVVGLGMDKAEGEDRKNITLLVKWFCEQFKGSQDVGLVLKVSMVNFSPLDLKNVRERIRYIKRAAGCGEFPRISLIHGRLSDRELAALYKHPKVKALVTATHGEGFGLPIIEAAACGLPVLATNWSGHLDFLQSEGKRLFVPIDYRLGDIPASNVWQDVMDAGSKHAYPVEADAKMKMAKVALSYDRPKKWAEELAPTIPLRFHEGLGIEFAKQIDGALSGQQVHVSGPSSHPVKPFAGDLSSFDRVTLVCASSVRPNGSLAALLRSLDQLPIKRAKLFTHFDPSGEVDPRVQLVKIDPIPSGSAYSRFVCKELYRHIDTDFCMIVQQDGYVLNGSAWLDEFLQYDYIGAPWFWDRVVGNGGFSIRSRRLMEELSKPEYEDTDPEDDRICRKYRAQLEQRGFTFAPAELAAKFSIENQGADLQGKYAGQLGWHGRTPFYGAYTPG